MNQGLVTQRSTLSEAIPVASSWILRPEPKPKARLRFFCFPYAGGGASAFASWVHLMPPEVEICAVQLPGRETRLGEKPFVRLPVLVQALRESLRPYLHGPFAFFGHSMGALICFELTRELRRARLPGPVHLFVSGHRAPHLPDPDPPIHQLPASAMVAELRRRYDTPETLIQNPELLELLLPVLRADLAVCETYLYSAEDALDSPITVYGGLEDPKVSRQELAAWRSQTRGVFDLRMFPGKHFFPQTAELFVLQSLGDDLKRVLNSAL